jgi:hypothetical protein
MFLNVFTL